MALNRQIIMALNEAVGCDITTPAGATMLANDIESKTGERLAANTIKRLVGILPYDSAPRATTLNILARYLGWNSWDGLAEYLRHGSSGFGTAPPFYYINSLKPGALIKFKWLPDRAITLCHIKAHHCEVVEAVNCKLMVGDSVHLTQVGNGYPFFSKGVRREGQKLGSYTAAAEEGIYDLEIEQ